MIPGGVSIGSLVGSLELEDHLSAVTDRARAKISGLGVDLGNLGDRVDLFGHRLQNAGQHISRVGDRLTLLTAPLIAATVGVVKLEATFESNMVKLVNIAGVGEKAMEGFRESVLGMTEDVGRGPVELSTALYSIASVGMRGAEALQILDRSARASAIGLGQTGDVAKAVVSAMTAWGKENLSAARASDILLAGVREGGAEADEFARTLGRVVSTSKLVGLSFEETVASIATFTRLGVRADEAVTALRGTLSVLLKPSKEARDQLVALGTSIEELRDKVRKDGLAAALIEMVQLTKGNDDAIAAIVPNVRALAGVLANANSQAGAYTEIVQKMKDSTGGLDEAFQRVSETATFKFQSALAGLQTAGVEIGAVLMPRILDLMPAVTSLIKGVGDLIDVFVQLPEPVQNTALGLGAMLLVAGPTLSFLGRAVELVGLLAGARGLAAVSGALPAVTAGFVGLGATIYGLNKLYEIASQLIGLFDDIDKRKGGLVAEAAVHARMLAEASAVAGRVITDIDEGQDILREQSAALQFALKGSTVHLTSLGGIAIPMVAEAAKDADRHVKGFAAQLADAQKEIDGLSKSAKNDLATGIKAGTFSMDALSKEAKISELAVRLFQTQLTEAGKAGKQMGKDLNEAAKDGVKRFKEVHEALEKLNVLGEPGPRGSMIDDLLFRTSERGKLSPLKQTVDEAIISIKQLQGVLNVPGAKGNDWFGGIKNDWWSGIDEKVIKRTSDWSKALGDLSSSFNKLGQISGSSVIGNVGKFIGIIDQAADASRNASKVMADAGSSAAEKFGASAQSWVANAMIIVSAWQMIVNAMDAQSARDNAGTDMMQAMRASQGSLSVRDFNLDARLAGIDVDKMWQTRGVEPMKQAFADAQKIITENKKLMEEYNLTWYDFTAVQGLVSIQQDIVTQRTRDLNAQYQRYISLGVPAEKLTRGMSGAFSQLLIDAVKTGTKIPSALEPMIESMIRMGTVTEEAAAALLGVTLETLPTLEELTRLAGKYGIELDSFGPKVAAINLQDFATDFDFLTKAGLDTGSMLTAVSERSSKLVQMAMAAGIALPETLRPFLQALVDTGQLVDADGKKLEDLSGVQFAKPLASQIEELILAMKELITAIIGVGDEAVRQGNRARDGLEVIGRAVPRNPIAPTDDTTPPVEDDVTASGARQRAASGGLVSMGRVIPFRPTGTTDNVPTMLTPSEIVINAAQQGNIAANLRGGQGRNQTIINIDLREAYIDSDERQRALIRGIREAVQSGGEPLDDFEYIISTAQRTRRTG